MNWIDKCRLAEECATIGNCEISRLLFDDYLVLLSIQNLACSAHKIALQMHVTPPE